MSINKHYNDYSSMNDEEKFAMRYGASGKSIGDVVRNATRKLTNPNKVFDAWVKGENLRKSGESKDFLNGIEKAEMNALEKPFSKRKETAANGITAEPIKDIWGNNLLNGAHKKAGRTKDSFPMKATTYISNPDNPVKSQALPRANNLLPNGKDYDIIHLSSDTVSGNSTSSGQTNQNVSDVKSSGNTHVTYGHSDKNVVGGIQRRLNEMDYKGENGGDIKITGSFDKNTESGIKKFQKDRDLPVTGVLDEATKKEMGFLDDYCVSRKGKNATPWMPPESPSFNYDAYIKEQERQKAESKNVKREKNNFSHSILIYAIAEFLYNHGDAQPFSPGADIIYDEYQKNIENDLSEFAKKYGEQAIRAYMEGLKSKNP